MYAKIIEFIVRIRFNLSVHARIGMKNSFVITQTHSTAQEELNAQVSMHASVTTSVKIVLYNTNTHKKRKTAELIIRW